MYLEKGTQTKNNLCHIGVDESLSITCPVNSISMASKFSGRVMQKMTIRYPYLRKEATGVRLGDRNFWLSGCHCPNIDKRLSVDWEQCYMWQLLHKPVLG